MKFLFHVILFYLCVKNISSFLNQNEMRISIELIKELEIRQCVLAGNVKDHNLVSNIKEFSAVKIPATYLNYLQIIRLIVNTKFIYFYSGLIFKEKDLYILEKIAEALELNNKTNKLQNFKWFVFLDNYKISKLKVPYDCEFIVIQPINERSYQLTEIYTIKDDFRSLNFGMWNNVIGLQSPDVSFYYRRKNLHKIEMTVISDVGMDKYWNDNLPTVKIAHETLNGLVHMMNATRSRYVANSSDEAFEKLKKTGDIIAYLTRLYSIENPNFDSLSPITKLVANWYIEVPTGKARSDYYLKSFDDYLWVVILSSTILGTVLIILSQTFTRNKNRNIIDNLFLGLESFCNQCGNDDIENASTRIICIILRLTALTSLALYGAIITSFLAVDIVTPPFTNMAEFVANGQYKILLAHDDPMKPILKGHNNNTLYQTINENFTEFINNNRYDNLLKKMCEGKYVIYSFGNDIHTFNSPCQLYKINEFYKSTCWLEMTIQKYSPFTKIFNKNLIRFYENGVQMIIQKNGNKKAKLQLDGEQALKKYLLQPIKMDQMTQVLMIPVVGILLGIAILVAEIVKKRRLLRQK